MSRKILISGLSILATLGIVSAATFAYFSDVGASNDNVFAAGNFNMQLSDGDQEDSDSVSGTWGLASAPGDTFTGDLRVTNIGSVAADHIELQFVNSVVDAGSGPGTVSTVPMDSVIEITTFGWDSDGNSTPDVDLLPGVTNTNANGIIDLDDLENQTLDDFDSLSFSGTQTADHVLRIAGRLHPIQAVDQHQGDQVTMTLNVAMNQNASK